MDLDRIRKMDDAELQAYLKSLADRKSSNCVKCGKVNADYTINIRNNNKFQQKKLCSLCEECYEQLLDTLKITDIIWE